MQRRPFVFEAQQRLSRIEHSLKQRLHLRACRRPQHLLRGAPQVLRDDASVEARQARVDDVSLGGCFVNTYGPVELNEPVSVQILLPAGVWLNLRGTVVTYQPGVGFGISFRSLTEDEETSLKELIASAIERTL